MIKHFYYNSLLLRIRDENIAPQQQQKCGINKKERERERDRDKTRTRTKETLTNTEGKREEHFP